MSRSHAALICAGLALMGCAAALVWRANPPLADSVSAANEGRSAHYDYYVMALSWSPTFCRTHPDEEQQCGRKPYGFVLHGLWPQYARGGGPQRCASDRIPDDRTIAAALAFMPSRRLISHEWRAHGSCSGLDPRRYFDLADRAFASIHQPAELQAPARDLKMRTDDLRASFRRANPGLRDDMLSLHCSRDTLVEVRVCLSKKDVTLQRCGEHMRSSCPMTRPITVPAVRQ